MSIDNLLLTFNSFSKINTKCYNYQDTVHNKIKLSFKATEKAKTISTIVRGVRIVSIFPLKR